MITLEEVLYDQPTGRLALVFELMDANLYELIRGRRHYLNGQVFASSVECILVRAAFKTQGFVIGVEDIKSSRPPPKTLNGTHLVDEKTSTLNSGVRYHILYIYDPPWLSRCID